ncbi:hypothetical protein [Embleya scabrispora]|uniref:hypothetical protein n=1 Tax=Embleya scabrispora TaxID=159449 RepID=UPI001F386997|nr:hypothetical protein [Embleya scabrispora]
MFVFVCAGCDAELTVALYRVCLPVHARQVYGNGVQLPVLMEPGTFALDPDPWERPRRTEDEPCAPADALPGEERGDIVIAPGDIRGTRLIPDMRGGACCGIDGADGPNLVCMACDLPVATRIDDCSLWQAVRLDRHAVRRVRVGIDPAPSSWEELTDKGEGTSPVAPIATWGGRLGSNRCWSWSPQWAAAAGRALAHLLVASEGSPIGVPDGLTADMFRPALDAALPAGLPPRCAVLAGPGHPAPGGSGIVLVPVHPQTGHVWMPSGPAASAYPVPLPLGVWLWLTSHRPYPPMPASGRMPRDVLRDDPIPLLPNGPFQADRGTFERTLLGLTAAQAPWLREALARHASVGLFQTSGVVGAADIRSVGTASRAPTP